MSQGIPGIRHFRKCLGNSGNAWHSCNCLGNSGNLFYLTRFNFWEKAQHQEIDFKLNLSLPNLT
jgi:hypothetical protein